MHVHLAGNGKPQKKQRDNEALVKKIMSNGLTKAIAYNMVCGFAKDELYSGVTTIRTVGGLGDFDTRLRDDIAAGKKPGPRILAANEGISVPGGHMAGSVAIAADSVEEALQHLETSKAQKVDLVKLMITGGVLDAKNLAEAGKNAAEIKQILEDAKFESSIYIMVDTLNYLKKGGRITPAAAALGTLLKLKPVLQIQGEKLDAFAKARTVKQAKSIMIDAMKSDFEKRFNNPDGSQINLEMAYTHDIAAAEAFKEEVQAAFPNNEIVMNPLSLSVSCHIGPGALAIACSKKIEYCNK